MSEFNLAWMIFVCFLVFLSKYLSLYRNNVYICIPKRKIFQEGIKITYSGDTRPCEEMIMLAKDSTLLIHESTFIQQEAQNAEDYGHSTAYDAAFVARESNSKELVITHISTRYGEDYAKIMLNEAKEVFENTKLAEDFMEIKLRG